MVATCYSLGQSVNVVDITYGGRSKKAQQAVWLYIIAEDVKEIPPCLIRQIFNNMIY